jgi:CubicO group peptidase (beta-lactamase class C family)
MRRLVLAGVCMAALWQEAGIGQSRLSPAEAIPPVELEAFVDGVVQQVMAQEHIAGVAVSIVQDGALVLKKGYGFADVASGRRVDPDRTLFRIGSITKTFTWLAVREAVEAKQLDLEGVVNQFLPPELQLPVESFTEPIRLRHLMTHSAGFEDRMFGHLFETDPAEVRPLADYLRMERPRRVREPGRLHSYSNYGVGLVGAMLEHVRGHRWQDLIEADILGPLEMRNTTVREPYPPRDDLPEPMPAELERNLSKGYRWTRAVHQPQAFEYITHIGPAGVISSTAGDMARYMVMLLDDEVWANTGTIPDSGASRFAPPASAFPPSVGNWYGGFLQGRVPGGFASIGHDGGSLLFFSSMLLMPELRLGVFITTNTQGGARLSNVFPSRIVARFYAEPAGQPGERPASRVAPSASRYNGFYLQTRRPYGGLGAFVFRLLARRVRVDADGSVVMALSGLPGRFVPTDEPDVLENVERQTMQASRVRYEGDRVARIETPSMAYERVEALRQPPVLVFSAALVVLFSIGSLARLRMRRSTVQTRVIRMASPVRVITSLVWLTAAVMFGVFAAAALADESTLLYDWPPLPLVTFSALALVATVLTAVMVACLPPMWRETEWTRARKVVYTATTLVFASFGSLLGWWGALQPWNP